MLFLKQGAVFKTRCKRFHGTRCSNLQYERRSSECLCKTIDQVDIRVLSVETHLAGRIYPGDRQELIAFMEKVMMVATMVLIRLTLMTIKMTMSITQVGYRHIDWAHQSTNALRSSMGTNDDLFVRNDIPLVKEEGWYAGEDLKETFGGKVFKKGSLEEKEGLAALAKGSPEDLVEKLANRVKEDLADHVKEEVENLSDAGEIGLLQKADRKEL